MYKTKSFLSYACRVFIVGLCFHSASLYAETVSRDPTEPVGFVSEADKNGKKSETAESSTLVLDAVLISGNDKFAIINNKLVKVGDLIGGSKVKQIEAYHVTLVGETGETVLELFGHPIKEAAK